MDEFYIGHIPGSEIISIDLETGDLYISDREGGIITINPGEQVEEPKITLPSQYEMKEVFIGNTGRMFNIRDIENNKEYYFKPAISKRGAERPYRAYIQEAAYRIQKIINPDRAVPCNTIEIDGMFGAIQEKIEIDVEATKEFRGVFEGECPTLYLGELNIISQIIDEYLVDFCLCNYDSHERNFIIDTNGNLRGIDKEQSFRYINEDKEADPTFSTNYNAKYGENPPIYNKIFEEMVYGIISNDFLNLLTQKAKLITAIPDDEYRNIFEQYAYGKCSTAEEAEMLLNNILDRKRNIQKSVEQLFDELIKSKHRINISPLSAVKNALAQGTTTSQINQAKRIECLERDLEHTEKGETKND